jgi:hypothetical protein
LALATLMFEAERIIDSGAGATSAARLLLSSGGAEEALICAGGGGVAVLRGNPIGGALARPALGIDVSTGDSASGGGVEVAERGMPFGGGGVAFFAPLSSAPAALLTQRFCSGS